MSAQGLFPRHQSEVVVIGAGPYGLSVAAHLRAAQVSTHVFGEPLLFWRQNMPKGMNLRSPWRATHIAEPISDLSLDTFFAGQNISRSAQLPLEQFQAYGAWVQQKAVPDLDRRRVSRLEAVDDAFHLHLEDGSSVAARRVVLAPGLNKQEYRPPEFDGLPRALVSHSSDHNTLESFRGRRVAVVGRGQSACESAALLHEAGAEVEIVCRGAIRWHGDPSKKSSLRKGARQWSGAMLVPPSQVGPFPINWLAEVPGMLNRLPDQARDWMNGACLSATAALWLRSRTQGVRLNEGRQILGARRDGDRVGLMLDDGERTFDHVLLATGYRIDLSKLGFIEPRLLERIARRNGLPVLSAGFESNVRGLHFAGSYAVGSFGPLLRFIAGAGFAARTIAQAIAGSRRAAPNLDGEWLSAAQGPLVRQ